jgi:hypothetical protein
MTIIAVSMLLVALPNRTNTIIDQQRQALAQANDDNNNKNIIVLGHMKILLMEYRFNILLVG